MVSYVATFCCNGFLLMFLFPDNIGADLGNEVSYVREVGHFSPAPQKEGTFLGGHFLVHFF